MAKTYGDTRDELDEDLREEVLTCACGATVTLDLDQWGLDWPEKRDGWCKTESGYICPSCRPDLVW